MKLRKYTEQQLREACASSVSIRQALIKLNVSPWGGNYEVFKKAVAYYSIDTTHFSGKASNSGDRHKGGTTPQPIEDIIVHGLHPQVQSYKLKVRLIKEGYFVEACSNCGLDSWLGGKIPLELDHIDGVNSNNLLENLRLLCPNCHALTPTYRAKNIKK